MAADVAENALAAAFRDPRFPPLSQDELSQTRVEVSLLEPSVPLTFSDEDDALARLKPGVDGLILKHGSRRATFLPQVWGIAARTPAIPAATQTQGRVAGRLLGPANHPCPLRL